MLTLALFVVVVAVYARWLITFAGIHYLMFVAGQGSHGDAGRRSPVSRSRRGTGQPGRLPRQDLPDPLRAGASPGGGHGVLLAWLLSPEATPTAGVAPGGQDGAAGGPWSSAPGSAADHTMAEYGKPRGDSVGEAAKAGPGHGESRRTSSGAFGRGGREERPSGWAAGEQSTGVRGLRPRQLQLNQPEIEFMKRLGPVMPTPRAAKKLANLSRLVRIGIKDEDLAGFLGSESGEAGGPYQVVQILLAVLVASPVSAQGIFRDIRSAPSRQQHPHRSGRSQRIHRRRILRPDPGRACTDRRDHSNADQHRGIPEVAPGIGQVQLPYPHAGGRAAPARARGLGDHATGFRLLTLDRDPLTAGLFPQRSPPRLLTGAACGGLGSPPARRTRRTCLHHWHSTVHAGDLLHRLTPLSGLRRIGASCPAAPAGWNSRHIETSRCPGRSRTDGHSGY